MPVRHAWRRLQRLQDKIWQDHIDRLACFLHIEEEMATRESVGCEMDGITDSHSAIAQQEHESWFVAKPVKFPWIKINFDDYVIYQDSGWPTNCRERLGTRFRCQGF